MHHLIEVVLANPDVQGLLGSLLALFITSEVLPFVKKYGGNGIAHALAVAFTKASAAPKDGAQ